MKPKNLMQMCGMAAAVIVLLVAAGCVRTYRARTVQPSGFLQNYSQLQPGTGEEALLTYTNPNVDFRQYNKIILDPIEICPAPDNSVFSKISSEDLQKLLNYLDAEIRKKLGTNFSFVTQPGPGVMRFRIALTEANSANVPMDVVSSVVPLGIAISALKSVTFGSHVGVGAVSAEFEAQDSQSGERFLAAVDRQIGAKYTGQFNKFSKWRATQDAFDYWAERLKVRLAELQNPASPPGR